MTALLSYWSKTVVGLLSGDDEFFVQKTLEITEFYKNFGLKTKQKQNFTFFLCIVCMVCGVRQYVDNQLILVFENNSSFCHFPNVKFEI